MEIILKKGFLSPIEGRNKKIPKSERIELLLQAEGWRICGSNFASIDVANGKELIHVMEVIRRIGVKEDLVISGWS